MARPGTVVRPVDEADWPAVQRLWQSAAAEMPMGVDALSRQLTVERLRSTLEAPGVSTLVAVHDDEPVGVVVLTASPLTALTHQASMTVEVLYVVDGYRGRGVGAQLLARAAALADAAGATHLASTAPASSRAANRFYARLGFNAAVTRRVVPTAALRRRLVSEPSTTDRVVARRRSLRARAVAARQRGVDAFGLPEHSGRHAV